MSAVMPFLFEGEHMVRAALVVGEPWFVGVDVASVLGYARPDNAVARHCKHARTCPLETGGQVRQVNVIPERDVYRLIMRSKLPAAEQFEEWVVGEVLPTIRKTGGYGQRQRASHLLGQRQAMTLMDKLKVETSPAIRCTLHAMLHETLSAMGVETPPLDAIGRECPPPPDLLATFRCDVAAIQAGGCAINHAHADGLLALRLVELRGRLSIPVGMELRRALKQSRTPRFVAVKAVNSALTGKVVKCWVFTP